MAMPQGFKHSEETKRKLRAAMKKANNRPEVKEKLRAAAKKAWSSSETKKKRRMTDARPDVKKRRSVALKEAFACIDVKNRRTKAILQAKKKNGSLKQTKPEIQLEKLLNQLLPNQYKFTGHGDFVLAGKCPDFVNINGEKKIIEMIGSDHCYENHTPEALAERVKLFKEYGFQTLLIYDYELKNSNVEVVKQKLLKFSKAA